VGNLTPRCTVAKSLRKMFQDEAKVAAKLHEVVEFFLLIRVKNNFATLRLGDLALKKT
jgi:hypothetical protein